MATATKQARSARQHPSASGDATPGAFQVFENNDGAYHWAIVSKKGVTLAQSGAYTSFDDAEQAATCVRDGAAAAKLAPRSADTLSLIVA